MRAYQALVACLMLFSALAHSQVRVDLKPYFERLNYFDVSERPALLEYEAQFIRYMQASLEKDESELSKLDGKTILYGTLFLSNTNQGIRSEQISFQELTQHLRLAQGNLRNEMLAREELILDSLKLAQRLLPEDYRIETWHGGHELYQEDLILGGPSVETFNKMVDLAKKDLFSYTALVIVSSELNLSQSQQAQMTELAQMVSDQQIPCVKNSMGKCFDPKLAPQTTEVGRLLTADLFLKDANRYVGGGKADSEGLRIKSGVSARVIYGMVKQKQFPNFKSLDWQSIYLKGRTKAVKSLLWKEQPVPPELVNSLDFKRAYSCMSCHAGGMAQ